jgi:hypothetical protein
LKIPWEQAKTDLKITNGNSFSAVQSVPVHESEKEEHEPREAAPAAARTYDAPRHLKGLKTMSEELLGTRGAFILDESLNILGRVPVKELEATLADLDGVYAVVMDGEVTQTLAKLADSKGIHYLIAQTIAAKPFKARALTPDSL